MIDFEYFCQLVRLLFWDQIFTECESIRFINFILGMGKVA